MDNNVLPKARGRRAFPTIDNTTPSTDSSNLFELYTSQADKYKERKEKIDVGLSLLSDVLNDDSSSNDNFLVKPDHPSPAPSPAQAPINVDEEISLDSDEDYVVNGKRMRNNPRQCRRNIPRKMTKSSKKILNNLNKLISDVRGGSSSPMNLSLNDDLELLDQNDELNKLKQVFAIRIKWKTKIYKFNLGSDEQFIKIIPEVSKQINVSAEKLKFIFHDEFLGCSETPSQVKFKCGDIIECFVTSTENTDTPEEAIQNDDSYIELKVQSNTEKKKISIKCHKLEPLRKVLEKYAALKNLDTKKLQLKFDGDNVDLEDSPHDMDMEDGDCIDMIISV